MSLVHMLWIDGDLPSLGVLSIHSYLYFGLDVVLWTYGDPSNVPDGVSIAEATDLMPREVLDRYVFEPGHKLALCGDFFSFQTIHRYGGWWAHTDTTLMRPLDITTPYAFGRHSGGIKYTVCLWTAPRASRFTQDLIDWVPDLPFTDWYAGMRPVVQAIEKNGLERFVRGDLTTDDHFTDLYPLFGAGSRIEDGRVRPDVYAIHWCGSGMPAAKLDGPEDGSFYDSLWLKYVGTPHPCRAPQ